MKQREIEILYLTHLGYQENEIKIKLEATIRIVTITLLIIMIRIVKNNDKNSK